MVAFAANASPLGGLSPTEQEIMAQGYIKLEIDPEQYEKVKQQITELYELADKKASYRIEIAAQQGVHWTAYLVLCLGVFTLGAIFGFWLAGI